MMQPPDVDYDALDEQVRQEVSDLIPAAAPGAQSIGDAAQAVGRRIVGGEGPALWPNEIEAPPSGIHAGAAGHHQDPPPGTPGRQHQTASVPDSMFWDAYRGSLADSAQPSAMLDSAKRFGGGLAGGVYDTTVGLVQHPMQSMTSAYEAAKTGAQAFVLPITDPTQQAASQRIADTAREVAKTPEGIGQATGGVMGGMITGRAMPKGLAATGRGLERAGDAAKGYRGPLMQAGGGMGFAAGMGGGGLPQAAGVGTAIGMAAGAAVPEALKLSGRVIGGAGRIMGGETPFFNRLGPQTPYPPPAQPPRPAGPAPAAPPSQPGSVLGLGQPPVQPRPAPVRPAPVPPAAAAAPAPVAPPEPLATAPAPAAAAPAPPAARPEVSHTELQQRAANYNSQPGIIQNRVDEALYHRWLSDRNRPPGGFDANSYRQSLNTTAEPAAAPAPAPAAPPAPPAGAEPPVDLHAALMAQEAQAAAPAPAAQGFEPNATPLPQPRGPRPNPVQGFEQSSSELQRMMQDIRTGGTGAPAPAGPVPELAPRPARPAQEFDRSPLSRVGSTVEMGGPMRTPEGMDTGVPEAPPQQPMSPIEEQLRASLMEREGGQAPAAPETIAPTAETFTPPVETMAPAVETIAPVAETPKAAKPAAPVDPNGFKPGDRVQWTAFEGGQEVPMSGVLVDQMKSKVWNVKVDGTGKLGRVSKPQKFTEPPAPEAAAPVVPDEPPVTPLSGGDEPTFNAAELEAEHAKKLQQQHDETQAHYTAEADKPAKPMSKARKDAANRLNETWKKDTQPEVESPQAAVDAGPTFTAEQVEDAVAEIKRTFVDFGPKKATPRKAAVPQAAVDAEQQLRSEGAFDGNPDMSDKEIHARHKASAPSGDLEFTLTHAKLSPALRTKLEGLRQSFKNGKLAGKRTEFYRGLEKLQDEWRTETNEPRVKDRGWQSFSREDFEAEFAKRQAPAMEEPAAPSVPAAPKKAAPPVDPDAGVFDDIPDSPKAPRAAAPVVKRSADFSTTGIYDVTLTDGTKARIFKDPESRTWLVDSKGQTGKPITGRRFGDTQAELLEKLERDAAKAKPAAKIGDAITGKGDVSESLAGQIPKNATKAETARLHELLLEQEKLLSQRAVARMAGRGVPAETAPRPWGQVMEDAEAAVKGDTPDSRYAGDFREPDNAPTLNAEFVKQRLRTGAQHESIRQLVRQFREEMGGDKAAKALGISRSKLDELDPRELGDWPDMPGERRRAVYKKLTEMTTDAELEKFYADAKGRENVMAYIRKVFPKWTPK